MYSLNFVSLSLIDYIIKDIKIVKFCFEMFHLQGDMTFYSTPMPASNNGSNFYNGSLLPTEAHFTMPLLFIIQTWQFHFIFLLSIFY